MKGIMTVRFIASILSIAAVALSFQAKAKTAPVYTVAKVSVIADADDAVAAKEKALAEAQQIALRRLMKRVTGWSAHSRLPILPNDMIERMVEGFAVRRESNSSTRYMATLDFTFEPNSVRDILNRFGLPYTDQQAGQGLLIPVMIEAGAARPGSGNAWYEAFSNIDTEHALTPLKLVPPAANLSASMVSDLSVSSRSVFETLAYQYRSENLILAVANVDAQATQLELRLVGRDAVGAFSLSRSLRVYNRDIDEAAKIGAEIAVKIIEGRWKTTRLANQGVLNPAPADLQTVALTAQFSGLRAWQAMRMRLEKVPGVQALDVKALNARGASLTIDFPGGADRLAQAAQSQGLVVEQQGNALVLVAR
jgi:hypothetical protein